MNMKRSALLLFTLMSATINILAQIDAKQTAEELSKIAALKADSLEWKLRGEIGAGFTTVQLNNWSGGGQSSVAFRGLFLGSADYARNNFSWENDVDLGYGIVKLGSQSFRKADDRIIVTSKSTYNLVENLRATGLLDFRTQFARGLNYDTPDSNGNFTKVSNFMAPGYLMLGAGVEYKPVPELTFLVAPVSGRAIFVLDNDLAAQGAFGVDTGKNVKLDAGFLLNAKLEWEPMLNVRWSARLNAFGRYEQIQLWVVTLENKFLLNVNDYLSVGLLTDVFYDDRVAILRDNGTTGPATQLRNQLLINFTWSVANYSTPQK